jgi:exopolysaccharide production protein ExoQ
MRRPWLAFLVLFGLFCLVGPYDWNNRSDEEAKETDLKTAVSGTSAGIEEGNSSRRFAVVGFALFAIVLAARTRWKERRGIPGPLGPWTGGDRTLLIPILAFSMFAAASALWADDPGLVARRIFVFLCVGAAAWAVARAWTLSDILLFTVLSCLTMLLASLGLEIVRGFFHPFDGIYRLMGLTHPNNHALEAAVVIICSLAAIRLSPQHRRGYLFATALACGLLLLTRSRTSILSVIIALGVASLYIMPKRRVFGIGLVTIAVALIIGVYGPDVIDSAKHVLLFGRQESSADVGTLTGRTELWAELLTYAASRPLVGYGFEGFWSPEHTANVSLSLGWVVPHAHNGYIDMLLALGVIGLALFVITLVAGVLHANRTLRVYPGNTDALFSLTLLVWMIVAMISEKVFPQTHYAAFLVMVVLAREAVTAPVTVLKPAVRAYARTLSLGA